MKTFTKTIFFFIFALVLSFSLCALSFADIPHLINYQGKLTDTTGKPVTDGTYSVTFRIYDAESAGSLLWEETQSVSIQKGIFSVMLGGVIALNLSFSKPYWLELKVGNEVMSPRQRMASAAYALNGVPSGAILMWSGKIADVPLGWALCDGANGTPDLRNRFVIGAVQDDGGVAKTNVTGSLTQSGDGQIPAHSHAAGTLVADSAGVHTHNLGLISNGSPSGSVALGGQQSANVAEATDSQGAHTHTISGSTANAGSGTKNIATYYALAYIMRL